MIIGSDGRVDMASQLLARYFDAGWCHVLIHMNDEMQCKKLQHVMSAAANHHTIACGFYRNKDENGKKLDALLRIFKRGGGTAAWWWKYFTVARAVVLGYNVMSGACLLLL